MIHPSQLYDQLARGGMDFYVGVPDSLLKSFCAYVSDQSGDGQHMIAANEGNAVALAMGYHLSTGKVPVVYLQNSGLGNVVNPLLSLADKEVYSVPILVVIGWRGEPGVKDEPQHVKQGRVTVSLLETMEIPYGILDGEESDSREVVEQAVNTVVGQGTSFALLVKKGALGGYDGAKKKEAFSLRREWVIEKVVEALGEEAIVVATTGKTSRELFECREAKGLGHERDFLTVGGMGHASQIALGIAMQKPARQVICIDGDGAALMHLGSLAINGTTGSKNFKHLLINNGAHESVGGQPTVGFDVELSQVALAVGYSWAFVAVEEESFAQGLAQLLEASGPALLEVRVQCQSRSDLGRPTRTPLQNKNDFMEFLSPKP